MSDLIDRQAPTVDVKENVRGHWTSDVRSIPVSNYMGKYIYADDLYRTLCSLWGRTDSEDFEKGVFKAIQEAPAENVRLCSKSKWIGRHDPEQLSLHMCSICHGFAPFYLGKDGYLREELTNFCPECGAKMTEADKELPFAEPYKDDKEKIVYLTDTGVSVRTYNALARSGIKTLNDLSKCTKKHVMKIRNVGQRCINELEEIMDKYGFRFIDDNCEELILRSKAIDAIADCTLYKSEIELRKFVSDRNLGNKWAGGVLDAIDAVKNVKKAKVKNND